MVDDAPLVSRACTACGRTIFFCKDHAGTTQVLDASAPIFIRDDDVSIGVPRVRRLVGYVSHFSTCPKVAEFRQSRAKKGSLGETS